MQDLPIRNFSHASQVSILISILYNQRDGYALSVFKRTELIQFHFFEPIDDDIEFRYFSVPMDEWKRSLH